MTVDGVPAGAQRRCAVAGSPIAHSLSPALHHAAYAHLGLDWEYGRHELVADQLAGFVAGCDPSWRGLSMTMPLKEAALELGEVDEIARLAMAANTLVFEDDGARRVYNTDVGGLVNALTAAGLHGVQSAVILGTGATARSTVVSLARLGVRRITVVARTPAKALPLISLADYLGVQLTVQPWTDPAVASDLLISTAAAGAVDDRAPEWVAVNAAVFDVIYDPWPTVLAQAGAAQDRIVLSGLDLLVHQAVLQVELMTGSTVPAEVLYDAGRTALAANSPA
ncbi:shikimate dehydrogenase [Microlunatus phosphovorus NM-1]|uniref:Shikimate dehydrogenase n=1 Tax=Microlunatus phosphovorus (strain ATCC 700054 / DSM 10555 / JCM 9379 / NBRC 101784 / NCIMB 13414 / VKM Ac-1990 / NM-1) TaxID=1032480 RepID=F5XH30_MICPN|nr:shikimate dehydrogenase [Microlunatus phosphovorus]BAK35662.1 shikimate dehydrogenase [Microlunatus phosphovorus NM-1]